MKIIQLVEQLSLTGIAALAGALIAAITFFWNIVQFLWTRTQESRERQFETYHNLVKQLVEGESPDVYVDRQAAVVFELRHFPRYYGYTERMLKNLKETWRKKETEEENRKRERKRGRKRERERTESSMKLILRWNTYSGNGGTVYANLWTGYEAFEPRTARRMMTAPIASRV